MGFSIDAIGFVAQENQSEALSHCPIHIPAESGTAVFLREKSLSNRER
jgi:hypothetical protein